MGTCVLQGNKTSSLTSWFCFKSERNNSYNLLISLTKKNTFSSLKSTVCKEFQYMNRWTPWSNYPNLGPGITALNGLLVWKWNPFGHFTANLLQDSTYRNFPSDQHALWCRKAFLPTKSGSFLLVAVAGKIRTGVNL